MAQYIDKAAVVAEIERRVNSLNKDRDFNYLQIKELEALLSSLDTLEVKDSYEQCVQYDSIKASIQAHAETYSFNIESKLFHQLTKEQQKLWRKEIEQACISGGEMSVELAKDARYKENLEVKEVDLEKELDKFYGMYRRDGQTFNLEDNKECVDWKVDCNPKFEKSFAKHFFELGLKAQKGEKNITRKEVENLKERFKPIHDSGRRMFGSEAYDSHIKEVLKFFGYDTEDGVIKEIFDI